METKAAVGADLYIDDTPHNVMALRESDLKAIVYTNPINRGAAGPRADNWDEVEAFVLNEKRAWEAAGKNRREVAGT